MTPKPDCSKCERAIVCIAYGRSPRKLFDRYEYIALTDEEYTDAFFRHGKYTHEELCPIWRMPYGNVSSKA